MKGNGALALLLASIFLAPILGGQVYLGATPMLDGFLAGIRGAELPFTGHAIVATLAAAALLLTARNRRVIQLPGPKLMFPLLLMLVIMGFSVAISDFRWVSWTHWLEWLAYGLVFGASIAVLGRDRGPRLALWALVAGTSVVAVEGILEYAATRATDPTWRIFSSFVNPNALAGMLLLVLPIALALLVAEEDRIAKLLAGSSSVLIGLALLLTQSRAGILSFLVGLGVLVSFLAYVRSGKRLLVLFAPLALMGLMLYGLQRPAGASPSATAVSRVGNVASTSEQSSGYRILLWQGAIDMMRSNPFGYGVGTYRYESSRSGRTPQTQFTHQGFLQLGVESGVLSLILWLSFLITWLVLTLRGMRELSESRRQLLAGVLAAAFASAAHNMFDSDWQHFGIGFAFLALLGIGVQLAADGSSPEHVFKPTRLGGLVAGTLLILTTLWHSALVEGLKSSAIAAATDGNREAALGRLDTAQSLAPGDGEISWIRAGLQLENRKQHFEQAARTMPSTRHLRMLARAHQADNEFEEAKRTLRSALDRDPNNLPTLLLLATLAEESGNQDEAREWLQRTISVESSSYWKVRALPELVPTETFEARIELARLETSSQRQQELLMPALAGLVEYAEVTAPRVKLMVASGGSDFAGESPQEVQRKLNLAQQTASRLREHYRATGEPTAELETLATRLESALGAFGAP